MNRLHSAGKTEVVKILKYAEHAVTTELGGVTD